MEKIQKKFYSSKVSNKTTLLCAIGIYIVGIMFIFLEEISLSVPVVWIGAGTLWVFRYVWQTKNPYIEINYDEITINKSPMIKRKINIQDIEKINKSTNYGIDLKIKNAKNIKISWFQVEREQRDELKSIIKEITEANKQN